MNNKLPIAVLLTFLFIVNTVLLHAQFANFSYSRSLNKQEKGWHQLELPKDISAKTEVNFADIRILGLTEAGDSIEVPYLGLADFLQNHLHIK